MGSRVSYGLEAGEGAPRRSLRCCECGMWRMLGQLLGHSDRADCYFLLSPVL